MAVQRLRVNLALEIRQPVDAVAYSPSELWEARVRGARLEVNSGHEDFPALLAEGLDVAAGCGMDVKAAAERLGISATQLVNLFKLEPRALEIVNRRRRELDLRALR
jgi:hypothetical protein